MEQRGQPHICVKNFILRPHDFFCPDHVNNIKIDNISSNMGCGKHSPPSSSNRNLLSIISSIKS